MAAERSKRTVGTRIAIALAAGIVLGGAVPAVQSRMGELRQPICHSRSDCAPRIMGGLQIVVTGWSCTTAFVARDTETRKLVLLTAGHCLAASGLSALWSHDGAPIGRASVEAFHPGSNADAGVIDLTSSRSSNEVYGSSTTDIRSVTGWASDSSQAVGFGVCRSGATSGWTCGTIIAADVDATIDGRLIHHTWWTDFPSAAGDSGSPVLDMDGRAAGILIATTSTRSLYSTIDWIATELHARPCVRPSCD